MNRLSYVRTQRRGLSAAYTKPISPQAGASATAMQTTSMRTTGSTRMSHGGSPGSEPPRNWLANTHNTNTSSSTMPSPQVAQVAAAAQLASPLLTPSNPFLQPTPSPVSSAAAHSKAAAGSVRASPPSALSSVGGVSFPSPPEFFNAHTPSDNNNPFLFSQTASPASAVAALCRSAGGAAPAAPAAPAAAVLSSYDGVAQDSYVQCTMSTLTSSFSTSDVQTVGKAPPATLPTSPVQIAAACFPASPPPAAEALVLPSPQADYTPYTADAVVSAEAEASKADEQAKRPTSPEAAAAASRVSSKAMETLLAKAAQADAEAAASTVDDARFTIQTEAAVEAGTSPVRLAAAAAATPDNDDHGAADAGGGDLFSSPEASRVVPATAAPQQQLPSAAAPREEGMEVGVEEVQRPSPLPLSPVVVVAEEEEEEEEVEEVVTVSSSPPVVAQAEVKAAAEAPPVVRSSWFGSWFGSSSARSSAAAPAEEQHQEEEEEEEVVVVEEAEAVQAAEVATEEVATVGGASDDSTPWWHAPPDAFSVAGNGSTAAAPLTPEAAAAAAAAAANASSSSGMPRPVAAEAAEAVERGRSMRGGSEDATESDATTPEHSPSPRAQSPDGWMMHTNAVAVREHELASSPLPYLRVNTEDHKSFLPTARPR